MSHVSWGSLLNNTASSFRSCTLPESCTPNSFETSRGSSKSASTVDLANIEKLAINVREMLDTLRSQHLIVTALLNYIDSADYILACTAMEVESGFFR